MCDDYVVIVGIIGDEDYDVFCVVGVGDEGVVIGDYDGVNFVGGEGFY